MEVFRISKCALIRQLDGYGAFAFGGRWNSKGVAVIYTAESRSMALLETLAHIERPLIGDFCRIGLFLPDDGITEYPVSKLPVNWRVSPPPDLLKNIGDTFIRDQSGLALRLPSVIVPEEFNYLINPNHPRFSEVRIFEETQLDFDVRIL